MLLFQTFVEYGVINSITATIANAWNHVEYFIGTLNVNYLLLAALVIIILLLLFRRRAL